ncbi:MAG TPA: hypothetical protein VG815_19015 [Chloroflexota bacterium]|jgi:hypothetical protein|nr:hypothetical protein [Chloroflexota bacterium]
MKIAAAAASTVVVFVAVATLAVFVRASLHPATMASYGGFNSNLQFRTPGTSVIGRRKAIRAAIGNDKLYWRWHDNVSAAYGLYSNNTMCTQKRGSNRCVLVYQRVRAWVVTVTGPDECMLPQGGGGYLRGSVPPPPLPTLTLDQQWSCQMNTVIDAKTGQRMESFN